VEEQQEYDEQNIVERYVNNYLNQYQAWQRKFPLHHVIGAILSNENFLDYFTLGFSLNLSPQSSAMGLLVAF